MSWLVLVLSCGFGAVLIVPLLLVLLNAFKSESDYLINGPLSLPTQPSLEPMIGYSDAVGFPRLLLNSVVSSGFTAAIGVTLSVLCAYAVGIGRIRGSAAVTAVLLFATMIPQEAILYPLFREIQWIGLSDSIWSVVLVFSVLHAAFGTYMLGSVLAAFPRSILEAAALDGASRWRILWQIVVPIVRPTLGVLAVFFFVWTWNEFMIPVVFLVDPASQTVPIGLATLKGENTINVTQLNAGSLLSLIPTLLFFLMFQRTLTRGMLAGSTK